MKVLLTMMVQKEFEATSDEDADAKVTAMQQALEQQGYTVQIESDDILDEDESEKEDEADGGDGDGGTGDGGEEE